SPAGTARPKAGAAPTSNQAPTAGPARPRTETYTRSLATSLLRWPAVGLPDRRCSAAIREDIGSVRGIGEARDEGGQGGHRHWTAQTGCCLKSAAVIEQADGTCGFQVAKWRRKGDAAHFASVISRNELRPLFFQYVPGRRAERHLRRACHDG